MYADLALENTALKDLIEKSSEAAGEAGGHRQRSDNGGRSEEARGASVAGSTPLGSAVSVRRYIDAILDELRRR